jgi:hypothetical protein
MPLRAPRQEIVNTRRRYGALAGALLLLTGLLVVVFGVPGQSSGAATADGAPVTTITMNSPAAYTPHAPNGGTDDYHCTLVNPHVNHNSFIVSSQFTPGSGAATKEVHHEITFLVPPSVAPKVEALNKSNKGWSCFGESPFPTLSLASLTETPWLSAWAPGHGKDVLPATTGTPLPAHSLVIMQVHYNLLEGDKPVKVGVKLNTVPASTHLRPLTLTPYPAPINMPCPADEADDLAANPLCSRAASLDYLAQRFGSSAVVFQNVLELLCGENISNPPEGDTVTCTQGIRTPGYIVRTTAHMHLLGRSMTMVVDPGTPKATSILDVKNYDFNYQRSYDLKKWVKVVPGDTVQFTCTYDPTLAQELPALRKAPPHFVTWGDGSSDEMCLGLIQTVPLNPHATVAWSAIGSARPYRGFGTHLGTPGSGAPATAT